MLFISNEILHRSVRYLLPPCKSNKKTSTKAEKSDKVTPRNFSIDSFRFVYFIVRSVRAQMRIERSGKIDRKSTPKYSPQIRCQIKLNVSQNRKWAFQQKVIDIQSDQYRKSRTETKLETIPFILFAFLPLIF